MLHLSASLRERESVCGQNKTYSLRIEITRNIDAILFDMLMTHGHIVISYLSCYLMILMLSFSVTIVTWLLIDCRLLIRSREMTGNSGLRRQTSRSSQPISLPGASASWHGTWIPTRFNRRASSCCWHAMNSNGFQWIMTSKQNH